MREGARDANVRAKASTTIAITRAARFFGIRDSSNDCRRPFDFPAAAFLPSAELKSDWFEAPFDFYAGSIRAEEMRNAQKERVGGRGGVGTLFGCAGTGSATTRPLPARFGSACSSERSVRSGYCGMSMLTYVNTGQNTE